MAIKVKDPTLAAQKFVQRAQSAAPEYAAGVANAGQTWQTNTGAAAQTWADGVTTAVANGRFGRGVQGAGTKYQTRASGVGAQRYPQGVAQAGPNWQNMVTPYLQVIGALTLPRSTTRKTSCAPAGAGWGAQTE